MSTCRSVVKDSAADVAALVLALPKNAGLVYDGAVDDRPWHRPQCPNKHRLKTQRKRPLRRLNRSEKVIFVIFSFAGMQLSAIF